MLEMILKLLKYIYTTDLDSFANYTMLQIPLYALFSTDPSW